ncbi:MAG: hypothetical protein NXI04_16535 [Planctomycetaceae bacterium]|nr:hypothetical protein [Planctomycetaceae bacterium]
MNARLLLLVLVTGLFMAAWDGDQAAMEAALARREQRIADARLARKMELSSDVVTAWSAVTDDDMAKELTHSLTLAAASSPAEPAAVNLEEDVVRTAADDVVPLPPGIAAGSYQAVNQNNGSSIRVTVVEGSDQPRDFYTVDSDNGDRWYIIRIAEQEATQL